MLPSFPSIVLFLRNISLTFAAMYLMYCTLLQRGIGAMGAFLPLIPRAAVWTLGMDSYPSHVQLSYTMSTIFGGIIVGFMFSYCLYLLLCPCPKITGFGRYMFFLSCCNFILDRCNRFLARVTGKQLTRYTTGYYYYTNNYSHATSSCCAYRTGILCNGSAHLV